MSIELPFEAGDTAYISERAKIGKLEKVVIKKVEINIQTSLAPDKILYTDTFNSIWLPDELITYDAAVVLVSAYCASAIAALESYIDSDGSDGSGG